MSRASSSGSWRSTTFCGASRPRAAISQRLCVASSRARAALRRRPERDLSPRERSRAMDAAVTYEKDVTMLPETASAYDVATAIQKCAVGCVVIVDAEGRPRGIVTDRDLAVRVISRDQDAGSLTASAVMSAPVFTAEASDPLARVIEVMCRHGIRRVPILRDSRVAGIVALDDVLAQLGREFDDLGGAARRQMFEARPRRAYPVCGTTSKPGCRSSASD